MSLRAAHLGALLLGVLSVACGPAAQQWSALAKGTRSSDGGAPDALRIEAGGTAAWVDYALAPELWSAGESAGLWSAPRPDGVGFMKSAEELALGRADHAYANQADIDNPFDLPKLAAGSFAAIGERLYLALPPTESAPSALRFSVKKTRGQGARAVLGGWTGDGFALWPGETMRFMLQEGAQRAVRFYWAVEGLAGRSAAHATLRLRQGGRELATFECTADAGGTGQWCRAELDARAGELAFELGGEAALSVVLAPRIGPAMPVARTRAQPDLVLFLADTLRADSLAYAGGPAELAPQIGALAEESLRFSAARSPSTWTLPSQASMLSALYPEQHGATSLGHALPAEIVTLAEVLQTHGFRTGAITDSAFVSRHYGFDQGFEWFQECRSWDLGATLSAASAFRAADDGRPSFLFVHTYRTHMPYRTGAEEDRAPLETLAHELKARCAAYGGDGTLDTRLAGLRLQALYQRGVHALDEEFGAWWPRFVGLNRAPTFLAFTSDHGEAFFEHDELGHGGSPWEEKIRIPLVLHGPGIRAGEVPFPASLVDLPRTLCALANVAAPAQWEGRDLLTLDQARASYCFVRIGEKPMVAVIEGARKVYALADPTRLMKGELRGGTDLERDPAERQNLASDEGWGKDVVRAQATAIEHLVRALVAPRRVDLSAGERSFLNDIGYGGE